VGQLKAGNRPIFDSRMTEPQNAEQGISNHDVVKSWLTLTDLPNTAFLAQPRALNPKLQKFGCNTAALKIPCSSFDIPIIGGYPLRYDQPIHP